MSAPRARCRTSLAVLAALVLCLLGPGAAAETGQGAQGAQGQVQAAPEEARAAAAAIAAEARRLYEAERHAEALLRFQAARRIYPSPDLLVYIAASLLSLQRDHEAAGALLEFFPDAAASRPELRTLALRLWGEVDPRLLSPLLGGLRPEARQRFAQADPRYLPPELLRLRAAAIAEKTGAAAGAADRVAPAPRRRRLPIWPGLVAGGLGIAGISVGAALLSIDDTCATPGDIHTCARVYATQQGGAAAVALGGAAVLAGGAWLISVAITGRRR